LPLAADGESLAALRCRPLITLGTHGCGVVVAVATPPLDTAPLRIRYAAIASHEMSYALTYAAIALMPERAAPLSLLLPASSITHTEIIYLPEGFAAAFSFFSSPPYAATLLIILPQRH